MTPRLLEIRTSGNIVELSHWLPAVLQKPLTGTRRCRNPDFYRMPKKKWLYTDVPLYRESTTGRVHTHIGLLSRILRELDKYGIPYHFHGWTDKLPEPDLRQVQALREFQPEVIAAIASSYCGVINCVTAFGKSFLIVQLCRMYPQLRILVISSAASVVGSLVDRIKADCPRKICKVDGSHQFRDTAEIAVSTDQSLHKIPGEWPDLLLFDEVHEAASETASVGLVKFVKARRFGFSASPKGRADLGDRMTEALFGPEIAKVSYQDAEAAGIVSTIRVLAVPCKFEFEDKARSDTMKKKLNYWRNVGRNSLIMATARAFAPQQILIFVETLEHAVFLRRYDPEFVLVHGGCTEERWLDLLDHGMVRASDKAAITTVDEPRVRAAFKAGTIKKVICTPIWQAGVDFPALSVLIRCDGMTGDIACTQIAGRLSRISTDKPYGVLVDFKDEFSEWANSRWQKREDNYVRKGWEIQSWHPEA